MSSVEEQETLVAQPIPTTSLNLSTSEEKVDTWSTREKLVLALSVATRGDQNWTGFRSTIKHYAEKGRSDAFFSNKSCATQYRKMLEEIEAPKRRREKKEEKKGRSTEEVPTELIIKKCKDEHMAELETRIKANIKEYCETYAIIEKIKSGNYDKKWYAEICKQVNREIELKKQKEQQQKTATAQPPPITPVKPVPTSTTTVTSPTTPLALAQATAGDSVDAPPLTDKSTASLVSKDEANPTLTVATEPVTSPRITRSPEKSSITSPSSLPNLSSPPAAVLPKLRSPVKIAPALVVEEAVKVEQSKLPQDTKDLARKDERKTAPDGTLKTDTDEEKVALQVVTTTITDGTTGKVVIIVETDDKKLEELPSTTTTAKSAAFQQLKDIIAMEQENSNDTIEEMEVDSVLESVAHKTVSQKETPKAVAVESKVIDQVKEEVPAPFTKDVSEKATASIAPSAVTPTAASTSKPDDAAQRSEKRKEPPIEAEPNKAKQIATSSSNESIVKKEEESSVMNAFPPTSTTSHLDSSNSTKVCANKEESTESSTPAAEPEEAATPAKRKRRSRASKTPASSSVIQTRSTRSQSAIKVEEGKETAQLSTGKTSADRTSVSRGGAAASKRLSNSIDETSLDSEELSMEPSTMVGEIAVNSTENDSTDTTISVHPPPPVEPIDNFWRKAALKFMTTIQANRHSNLFANENSAAIQEVREYVFNRQHNLSTIKKRINEGHIRSWSGLENEMRIMFHNVYVTLASNHPMHRAAMAMDDMVMSQIARLASQPLRRPGRPAARVSAAAASTPTVSSSQEVKVKVDRRKTRGSISVEKPLSGSKKRL